MVIKAARRSPTGAHGRELAGHQSTGSQRTIIRPDTRDTAAVPDFEFAVIEGRTSRAFTSAGGKKEALLSHVTRECFPSAQARSASGHCIFLSKSSQEKI